MQLCNAIDRSFKTTTDFAIRIFSPKLFGFTKNHSRFGNVLLVPQFALFLVKIQITQALSKRGLMGNVYV